VCVCVRVCVRVRVCVCETEREREREIEREHACLFHAQCTYLVVEHFYACFQRVHVLVYVREEERGKENVSCVVCVVCESV